MAQVNPPSNVTVVVVSYNTCDKLRRCLSCIESEHAVVVVDNASSDGSVEMVRSEFPSVRLIKNLENVGFGAANNQGIAVADRELVLFLNSDCYAEPGAISKVAEVFEDTKVVGAGGMLLNPDGSLQESVAGDLTLSAVYSEQFLLEKLWPNYWLTKKLDVLKSQPVPQVMGACLMVRPVERFDERFFLYCEDTDLCLRLRKHGEIWWVPSARFMHELGSSSPGRDRWLAVARYNAGKELYFRIHQPRLWWECYLMNRAGAWLRVLFWGTPMILTLGLIPRLRNQTWLFIRVLTAPLRGPRRPPRNGE